MGLLITEAGSWPIVKGVLLSTEMKNWAWRRARRNLSITDFPDTAQSAFLSCKPWTDVTDDPLPRLVAMLIVMGMA